MTLADRIADVLLERGPLPACLLAPAVKKQKAEVLAVLYGNPERFVHNGLKARASRWDVRPPAPPSFDAQELAARWGCDVETATEIVFGAEGFIERGYFKRLNGNGRVVLTERGLRASLELAGARA